VYKTITTSITAAVVGAAASIAGAQCGSSSYAKDACGAGEAQATPTASLASAHVEAKDIVQTAQDAGQFETLLAAAKAAGLVDTLSGEGPLTVFAPTDEAFAKLGRNTISNLLKPENRDTLRAILLYHVVPGRLDARSVTATNDAASVNGQRIDFSVRDGKVYVDNAQVVAADVNASNGVVHAIDSVIVPETKNLVEVAGSAGQFTILAKAVEAAGLADVLTGKDSLTVFAPTDEAFGKLPQGTLESLLKPENRDKLVAILTYHVVPGRVYARDAAQAQRADTVQGQPVRIDIENGRLTVDGASIVASDIEASNGVIHVIDRVILPQ